MMCDLQDNAPKDGPLFFDVHGDRTCKESDVEFIVTTRGDVISLKYKEFVICEFWDDDTKSAQYAPGIPYRVQTLNCDTGKVMIEFKWLQPDMCKSNAQLNQTQLMSKERSSLPLHAINGILRHAPRALEKNILKRYATALEHYHQLGHRNREARIGAWSTYKHAQKGACVDVADLLEFYFITPTRIWETRLGKHLWMNVVFPVLALHPNDTFFHAICFAIVDGHATQSTANTSSILSSGEENDNDDDDGGCTMCMRHQDFKDVISLCCVCIADAARLFRLRDFICNFRAHGHFDMSLVLAALLFLKPVGGC